MIGTLARKRTQLRLPLVLAAALIVALAGAMFAGSAPTRAATGDVSANSGFCVYRGAGADGNVKVGIGSDTNNVTVEDAGGDTRDVRCPAAYIGRPVTVTPNGSRHPTVTVLEPTITLSIDGFPGDVITSPVIDRETGFLVPPSYVWRVTYDNLIQFTNEAGTESSLIGDLAPFRVSSSLIGSDPEVIDGSGAVRLPWARITGDVAEPESGFQYNGATWGEVDATIQTSKPRSASTSAITNSNLRIQPGSEGQFTFSARVDYDENTAVSGINSIRTIIVSRTFTVVRPDGADTGGLAAATLALAGSMDNPLTSANEAQPGTGVAPAADGSIWLKIDALNALGESAGSAAVTSITAQAAGGSLQFFLPGAGGGPSANNVGDAAPNSVSTPSGESPPTSLFVQVSKANKQAGTVNVRAYAVGGAGLFETETITLTFTGAATALALGDDAVVGKPAAGADPAMVDFSLSATDSNGNTVPPGSNVLVNVTDADGTTVPTTTIGRMPTTNDAGAPVARLTVNSAAAAGVYTVSAMLPNMADSVDTATLTISGAPANLEVSADKTGGTSVGDVITLTATVTDADGVAVADGMTVTFTASGEGLVSVGEDTDSTLPGSQASTRGGVATARFTTIGAGSSVITAVIGNQTKVVVVTNVIGAAADEEEEAVETAGLHCLTNLIDFTTWICETRSTASEMFALLESRGATALHLHNGTRWVRYSVVNGQEVPGSSDFTIRNDDILYISN